MQSTLNDNLASTVSNLRQSIKPKKKVLIRIKKKPKEGERKITRTLTVAKKLTMDPRSDRPVPGSFEEDFLDTKEEYLQLKVDRSVGGGFTGPVMDKNNRIVPHSILGKVESFNKHQRKPTRMLTGDNRTNSASHLNLLTATTKRFSFRKNTSTPNLKVWLSRGAVPSLYSRLGVDKALDEIHREQMIHERLEKIEEGKKVEQELEKTQRQKLSRGKFLIETKQERILRKYREEQDRYARSCKSMASRLNREMTSMVTIRADNYRAKREQIELLESLKPVEERYGPEAWYRSLRQSADSKTRKKFDDSRFSYIHVGSNLTGLWSRVKEKSDDNLEVIRRNGNLTSHQSLRSTKYFDMKVRQSPKKVENILPKFNPLEGDLEVVGTNKFESEMEVVETLSKTGFTFTNTEENESGGWPWGLLKEGTTSSLDYIRNSRNAASMSRITDVLRADEEVLAFHQDPQHRY